MKFLIFNKDKNRGFTLIELIVVMAIFMLVVAVTVVIFISIIDSQRRILAQEQMLSQISYGLEYMSKGLRMAKTDSTGVCFSESYSRYVYLYTRSNISQGIYNGIKFVNENDNSACQEFYLHNEENNNVIRELKNSTDDNDSTLLTAQKYNIKYFRAGVNGEKGTIGESFGASSADGTQPRITTVLGIELPNNPNQPIIKIQTTVSQRNLNAE